MAHPAQHHVEAARKKRSHPAGVVEGKQAAVRRLDRKGGGAVDVSTWRPPVSHDLQPLNQEVIDTSLDVKRGISDRRGDIPDRKKYASGGGVRRDRSAGQNGGAPSFGEDWDDTADKEAADRYSREKDETPPERGGGGGIHIKPSHKGLLHKDLGVPAGQPIPAARMEKAKASASPAEKKRITFAENAKHWNHG